MTLLPSTSNHHSCDINILPNVKSAYQASAKAPYIKQNPPHLKSACCNSVQPPTPQIRPPHIKSSHRASFQPPVEPRAPQMINLPGALHLGQLLLKSARRSSNPPTTLHYSSLSNPAHFKSCHHIIAAPCRTLCTSGCHSTGLQPASSGSDEGNLDLYRRVSCTPLCPLLISCSL